MKKNSPIVSIIIPVFNQAILIKKTLQSIASQSYLDWECIIVDDGSNDKSVLFIREFCKKNPQFNFFQPLFKNKKGANACRNYGFQKSTGKYIQWFDADDLMHPDFLKLKQEKLENSNIDFVVCEGEYFKGSIKNIVGKWDNLQSTNPIVDHALGKINFQTNAPMFKRTFLEGKKLWNEKLLRKQDYEFFSRLLAKKPTYEVINKSLFYYRVHEKSINGRAENKSLSSLIKADLLVFNNVKEEAERLQIIQQVRQHFLRKTIARIKNAMKNSNPKAVLLGILSLTQFIDLPYLKNYFRVN
ncbi:glycosyltransferase family 2 protein [Salegentibacter sp. BDJ18]|uniref:glycosyltransferase family 2 protein n=1 Tax=Salegentibacter sp. BDJ18 TaxID=2816376 RepID=UPI001AAE91DC|nr:glycosyltransferase family 2 protein [Salegentibacter sp. BDJ18]MBO2544275.1 glycosyltransferase family 2 protein [Salegentibacter sp. BDJ18]